MKDASRVLLLVIWMIQLYTSPAGGQARLCYDRPNTFLDCAYKCHCINNINCDTNTGQCNGTETCAKGWFGPACQYADLMYTDSADSTPAYLRDGDDSTCNTSPNSLMVIASLKEAFPFTWLRLVITESDADLQILQTINVRLEGSQNAGIVTCNKTRIIPANSKVLDVYCDGEIAVQSVTITGEGVNYLCSIYFSGGRNIALNEAASQSSTRGRFTSSYGPQNAVDGNTDGNDIDSTRTCTHTIDDGTDKDAYWIVEFSRTRIITRYVLYNRLEPNTLDCCRNRLKGFNLTSYTTTNMPVFTYQDQMPEPQAVYTVTTEGITTPVSYVVIKANKTREGDITPVLTLCEVEIYGDSACPAGKYGFECTKTCGYCNTAQDTCEVSTGACLSGCGPGLYGERCKLACPDTYYGSDCKDRCSENCLNQLCDKVTGACLNCAAGKKGTSCEEDCPGKFYGQGCRQLCSTNCVDELCDAVNGSCKNCVSGKKGHDCTEDCEPKTYGPGCTLPCSDKCLNQLCDPVSGNCYDCTAGKMGDFCEKTCGPGTYGPKCSLSCDPACQKNCDPIDGVCTGDCPAGYRGQLCNMLCGRSTYGSGCSKDCSQFCNTVNGTGDIESPCHHVTGTCIYGCLQGYEGALCEAKKKQSPPSSSSDLGVGLGIGLGVAALIAIIGVAIYCYRRRSKAQRARRQIPPGYDPADPTTDEHKYSELFKSADDYNLPTDMASSSESPTSPPENIPQDTVQYVNADVGHYEDIGQMTFNGESEGNHQPKQKAQSEAGKDNPGYANVI